ncbi:hypothetical protein [Saccharopolyspora cebuensis]|uniref:hypothetical protein n=1 Tax=Saccharopolyspora cebuensis TaxID=418759 RepID=UPI0031F1BB74
MNHPDTDIDFDDRAEHPGLGARVRATMAVWLHVAGNHLGRTREWARHQPPAHLATGAGLVLAGLVVAWLVLWLLAAVLSGLIGWISGSTTAPPAPAPPAAETPPGWVRDLAGTGLWDQLTHTLLGYAARHAPAAGMTPPVLLGTWVGIGVLLLLAAWWHHQRLLALPLFWAWTTATCLVLWTHTPGASPVPAVLAAALAALISTVPWTTLPVTALITLAYLPLPLP